MLRPHKREAASAGILLHLAKLQQTNKTKMSKMTIVQLGVLVFTICLSTQVVSQNSTDPTAGGNSTSNLNTTTMATGTYSSSANTTSANGAGVSLHPGTFSFLIPVLMAASVLQRYC